MLRLILLDLESVVTLKFSVSPAWNLLPNTAATAGNNPTTPKAIVTWAGDILNKQGTGMASPLLDGDLGRCVALCCAQDGQDRPDLVNKLYNEAIQALNLRTPDWYHGKSAGKEWESDENAERLVRSCMFDAVQERDGGIYSGGEAQESIALQTAY